MCLDTEQRQARPVGHGLIGFVTSGRSVGVERQRVVFINALALRRTSYRSLRDGRRYPTFPGTSCQANSFSPYGT